MANNVTALIARLRPVRAKQIETQAVDNAGQDYRGNVEYMAAGVAVAMSFLAVSLTKSILST